ncbi:hypothetical protein COV61_02295 [Candidatus Micrarchaeota archaeon CG11_big_fil_rev_8_21_14_0_20_47_5]|nr:MAG: hypothetical protein AUJ17_01220 [Candidatus Micrarchaeota archaeon CG1_02_47_40]PIN83722.1 MAG: hypothetical protein COV61_02295 [Candidatus Micrarchaeota archaeon CG11_big_fil_rev_8_21_14_0_20_47_5]
MGQDNSKLNKDSRMLSAVSYASAAFFFFLFPLLAPLLIYLFIKEDKFVRFNALQALLLAVSFAVFFTLLVITIFGIIIAVPALILYWIYCVWAAADAYRGRLPNTPFISDFVKLYI